jgi:hypothetical protein
MSGDIEGSPFPALAIFTVSCYPVLLFAASNMAKDPQANLGRSARHPVCQSTNQDAPT